MTTDHPLPLRSQPWEGELRLNPDIHGRSRVPGPRPAGFDLGDFARALEEGDLDRQRSQYAPEVEVVVIDPDNTPAAPQVLQGRPAVDGWLLHASTSHLGLRVTELVDGGERVAFTERWQHQDGTSVVATSTAVIEDSLIAWQQVVLVWDHDGGEGW